MRNIIDERDQKIKELDEEKENLNISILTLLTEVKNLKDNKKYDDDLLNQINSMKNFALEKEKIIEEKNIEIKNFQNLMIKQQNFTNNNEKEKINYELNLLKKQIESLKIENRIIKDLKEKIIFLENKILENENNSLLIKSKLISSENENEKLSSNNRNLMIEIQNLKNEKNNLEKDLVYTKQKLGDAINEISEYEEKHNEDYSKNKNNEKKKTGFSSLFSKK